MSKEARGGASCSPFRPHREKWGEELTGSAEQGSVRLGYCCSQVPVEIILAAGFKPVRLPLSSSPEAPTRTSLRMGGPCCMRLRRLIESVKSGGRTALYGLVMTNGCDAMLRFHSLWGIKLSAPCTPFFNHLMQIPFRCRGEVAVRFYHRELLYLKECLESHFAIEITDADLRAAIRKTNRIRRSLRDLRARAREASSRQTGGSSPYQGTKRILVVGPEGPEKTLLMSALRDSYGDVFFDPLGCTEYPSIDCLAETPGETPLEWIARHYVLNPGYCPKAANEAPKNASFARWMGPDPPPCGILLLTDPRCRLWRAEAINWEKWTSSQRIPLLWINGKVQRERVLRAGRWLDRLLERKA